MRAEELTAEFGIAGLLDFVETEHGLVKAAISLDGVTGELCLQGAQVTTPATRCRLNILQDWLGGWSCTPAAMSPRGIYGDLR